MTATKPLPRPCHYYGTVTTATVNADGTWIEDEAFAYRRADNRRAYVKFEDGTLGTVRCGVADTFFSVPAVARRAGKRIKGFVSSTDDGSLKFTAYSNQ
jgi:hypothetical protein